MVYFASLAVSGFVILVTWKPLRALSVWTVALPFSIGSLYVCWKLIFAFMAVTATEKGCGESAMDLVHCSTPSWMEFDVFVQAYIDVTKNSSGWLMSSQLLMFVASACTFLLAESSAIGMPRYLSISYIILGFLGAISLAFPLFFAHVFCSRSHTVVHRTFSIPMAVCAVLAIVSVAVLPVTWNSHRRTYYTGALMLVHCILGVPSLLPVQKLSCQSEQQKKSSIYLAILYLGLAGASMMMHIVNWIHVLVDIDGRFELIFQGAFGTLCQKSISLDVCLTSIACIVYMLSVNFRRGSVAMLLTPVVSIAVTFPFFQALQLLVPCAKMKTK